MSGSEREKVSTQPRLRREALHQVEVPPCLDCGEPRFSRLASTRRCCTGHSQIVGGSNPSKKAPEIPLGPDPEIAEEEKEEADAKTGAVKDRISGSKSVNPVSSSVTTAMSINPVSGPLPTAMSVNPVPDSSTEADHARLEELLYRIKAEAHDSGSFRKRVMEALNAEKFHCPHCSTDDTVFLRDFNNNKLDRPRYRCKKCPRPQQRFTVGATLRGSRPSRRGADHDRPEEKLQLVAVREREKSKPSPSLGRRQRGLRRSGVVIKQAEEQNKSPTTSSSSTSSGKSGSQPRKLQKGEEPAVMSPLRESARMNIIEPAGHGTPQTRETYVCSQCENPDKLAPIQGKVRMEVEKHRETKHICRICYVQRNETWNVIPCPARGSWRCARCNTSCVTLNLHCSVCGTKLSFYVKKN